MNGLVASLLAYLVASGYAVPVQITARIAPEARMNEPATYCSACAALPINSCAAMLVENLALRHQPGVLG